ncbi:MAG: prepilin peptidase [Desulfovibrio sp.]|nr:prepilin peptidase [Desulfovibrio sp.]
MNLPLVFDTLSGAMIGAVFGSFFSAAAWAYITGAPFWRKRSVCDVCGEPISPLGLFPIFGFIFLRGKCRVCDRPIPVFHFFMEILPAAVGAAVAWRYGATVLALCLVVLATALIAACAVDWITRVLPDAFTLGAYVLLPPVLLYTPSLTLRDSLLGFLVCGGLALTLKLTFKYIRKKDGLGLGDVKLFALAGTFCGLSAAPCLFLLSACGGLFAFLFVALSRKGNIWDFRLPFGPFIGAAWIALMIFPDLPLRLAILLYGV